MKLANNMLSDTLNITCRHLINAMCQLSYQHLTFIMLNDILVLAPKITGVSARKLRQKWEVKAFTYLSSNFAAAQFLTEGFWLLNLMAIQAYKSRSTRFPRGRHNEINALMNMYGWRRPSVLHRPLFFQQLTNTQPHPHAFPMFQKKSLHMKILKVSNVSSQARNIIAREMFLWSD